MPENKGIPEKAGGTSASGSVVSSCAEHTHWERERELTFEFLRLLNAVTSTRELLDVAIHFFQKHSGCEAVGILLSQELESPYFHARGLSGEVHLTGDVLCVKDCFGQLVGEKNAPALECVCGGVVCGDFNGCPEFITPRGSFWTNSTSEQRTRNAQAGREPRTRGNDRCRSDGYESIALIPLRKGSERIGLLQLNDTRKGCLSPEAIALWEGLADHLASALARFHAEDTLRTGETEIQSVLESLNEGLLVADQSGRILRWNHTAAQMHDYARTSEAEPNFHKLASIFELRDMDGKVLPVAERPLSRVLRGERLHQVECQLRRLDRDNWKRVFSYNGMPICDAQGRPALAVVTLNDITERKQAEAALDQSEERARILYEHISDALHVRELKTDGTIGRFLEVNDVFCQRLGYTREEMLTMSPVDIDDPASGISSADVEAQLARKNSVIFEQVHVAKDGTRIPVEIHARLITFQGRPAEIALVRDIRERKHNERALRESEQRLTQAVRVAKLGIFECDTNTGVIQCSPTFKTILGFADSAITIDDVMGRVLPEDREEVISALHQSFNPQGDGLFQREHRITHPTGIRWVLVLAETFFEGEGEARRATRIVGAVQDITAQKQTELELSAGRQQLRTALNAAKLGIWNRDLETNVITGDALARSIYGWTEDEIVTPETILNSIPPEDRAHFLEQRARAQKAESNLNIEYCIQLADGDRRWVAVWDSRVRDSFGNPIRLTGVVQDITERKRSEKEMRELEDQIRHSQKMEAVGRLAGGIAHDFNNLLMVVRCYTEILEDRLPPFDALRKNTQAIMKAADRAARLTGQMLAFSRKQVLSPVALNLNIAVAESARMLQRLIGEDIELHVIPAETAWTVRADPDQIAQVLMNLGVNARDAMPEGGTLTIATRNVTIDEAFVAERPYVAPGDYAVFSVTDTGTGITKAVQERMFEPFFTTKSVGKGTGLGLSTVYGIIKQSGGYLFVDSEPGRGACFTAYLPRVKDAVAGTESNAHERKQRGSGTLLVVEDEDALRESIREFLSSVGYTVLSAESGIHALAVANEFGQPIDLMITDVVMPRMGGRELSQALARIRPELKTIFMSGYTDDAAMRHGVQEAGVAFLQKPFSLATLARKVREMIA
jgi:PAS domain S-box-containing protein